MATNTEERHLETKIRMTEDALLRTNDPYEIDILRNALIKKRKTLQKIQFANNK